MPAQSASDGSLFASHVAAAAQRADANATHTADQKIERQKTKATTKAEDTVVPYVVAPITLPLPTGASTTPASATGTAATATATATSPAGATAQPTPPAPATPAAASGTASTAAGELNAKIASGAALLTSQPTTNLATLSHDTTQLAQGQSPSSSAKSGTGPAPSTDGKTAPTPASIATDHDPAAAVPSDTTTTVAAPTTQHPTSDAADKDADPAAAATAPASADGTATAAGAAAATPAPVSAQAQTDTAVHETAPVPPAVMQVAISIQHAVKDGNNEIKIQLTPESLGAIDVKLNVGHDGRVTAVITADRADTLNMMKQDAGGLHQALRDAGLQTDSGSLSFNLRSDSQSFAQNARAGNGSGSGRNSGNTGTSSDDIAALPATRGPRQHAGSLDIQV